MQRVLSLQMIRGIDETSEYVTKRMCISFLLSVGFICLLCGFLLGRFAAERSMEVQAQKTYVELAGNGLINTDYLQQLALQKLERISFEPVTTWQAPDLLESNMQRVNEFFSNLSFIHKINNYASCVRAVVRGAREPDRQVILSVNGDGIAVALKLAQILDEIYSIHNWRPRRSLTFCVSLASTDVCPQTLPIFMQRKIVAYVALHGRLSQDSGHVALFGSDVMRSVAVEAIKTIPGDSNWTYLEHEVFGPRLSLDIPQVAFSFVNESNLVHNVEYHDQSSRGVILGQMVSQTIWRLSDSIIIQWKPQYLNETINRMLESIDIKLQNAKEKLKKTWQILLAAVEDLNEKIDATDNTQTLSVRMWNDLLLDLDKALLCLDKNAHSRTDITRYYKLSVNSSNTLAYLNEMVKCYEDAIQVLQER
ncbi:uncharacterized protein LOC109851844 isoform X2 [Pseudomyrmex gracilis]|uniref:uncharacterized protein LOC109851844 isoform X2 n=1 Tax=Pseudomyrmex gracilis TaxID=219809 RepID=UPI000995959D|nr:uncharacterized protein LOC109851844 isoform X2 [Pseudomyrmex gracilis]